MQANPSRVRDGDSPSVPLLAGNTAVINAVLTSTFGANQPLGTPWPTSQTTGLGPNGKLNAPYTAPTTLGGIASAVLASQAQDSATTSTQADTELAVQTTLASKLSAQSGVNMDTEMSNMIQLQNAYGANARVIAAVQSMWDQLLQSVR
jgi:flagellar hook-associated protein 1 FlgK